MKISAEQAMLMAIAEGKKGAGFVSPNPLVGCTILDRDYNLLSTGYHAKYGEAHAEANAGNCHLKCDFVGRFVHRLTIVACPP